LPVRWRRVARPLPLCRCLPPWSTSCAAWPSMPMPPATRSNAAVWPTTSVAPVVAPPSRRTLQLFCQRMPDA